VKSTTSWQGGTNRYLPKIGIAGIAPLYVCAACGTERTGLAHGIHPVWQMMYTAHVIIICNINVLKCSA